jgi:hypothetical protein
MTLLSPAPLLTNLINHLIPVHAELPSILLWGSLEIKIPVFLLHSNNNIGCPCHLMPFLVYVGLE